MQALTEVNFFEHSYPVVDISKVQGILESSCEIATMFRNLCHSSEFGFISGGEVQERELIELSQLLVRHLDNLMISMCESLRSQP
jgi:hypothetical protein